MRDVLQQSSFESRDYENELGAQTLCKMLSDLAVTTDVQKLNEKPTLWQANWVEVGWPEGWQPTLVPDFTTRPQRSGRERVNEREKRFVAFTAG